jgi:hypothetical protein
MGSGGDHSLLIVVVFIIKVLKLLRLLPIMRVIYMHFTVLIIF